MVFSGLFWDDDEPRRARPKFNTKDKQHLYATQKGKCNGCGTKFPMRNMTVDHIKPFSRGGSDKPSNLQLLCNACNSMKGDGTQAQLMKRLKTKGIIKSPTKATATKAKTTKAKTAAKKRPAARRRPPAEPRYTLNDVFGDIF